jgi:hypothetical protein
MTALNEKEKKQLLEHFPEKISKEMVKYVEDVVLLDSRYLFVSRKKKIQHGYCTHCKGTYETNNLKHNDRTDCPGCGSRCSVKQSGLGRKTLYDTGYFEWFEKSKSNPEAIVATGVFVRRDYSGDYKKVETKFSIQAYYVFEPGKGSMVERYWWNQDSFHKRKTVFSLTGNTMANHRCFFPEECIREAVRGTPFQYSTWEQYTNLDLIKFFDLAAKYPCVEYLTKLGLDRLVVDKLISRPTYRVINWRGKTLQSVLRVNKQDLKELRNAAEEMDINPACLFIYQESIKDGSNLSLPEIFKHCDFFSIENYMNSIKELRKHINIRKIFNYSRKQYSKAKKRYYTTGSVFSTWVDYLNDCAELNMDVSDEYILFPKDLYQAHQRTIARKKAVADEALNKKIQKRAQALASLRYADADYLIRPAESSNELVEEGNKLKHCVGGYIKSYADGNTVLLVIRKVSKPSVPFYTVEVRNGDVTQVYGYENKVPTKKVEKFVEVFKSARFKKQPGRKKVAS